MIFPTTYLAALLLLVLSMVCWGSWANTYKLVGKWRFELFYYDYAIGVAVCAVIAAFTFGSMNQQELTFSDNFLIAAWRKDAWGFLAGVVFNLANMLLVAAISLSGMAVAFPVAIGLALIIGVVWNFILNPQGNAPLLFGGAFLVLAAIVVDALAYRKHLEALALASRQGLQLDPRTKQPVKKPVAARGIAISIISGILMGMFYPLVEMGKEGESGVSAYGIALLFAAGVLGSTVLYNPFFMSFPVQGEPIMARDYFKGTKGQHFWGVFGGIVWCSGAIANFVAASSPTALQVGPAVSYAIGQGATLVSALWGVLIWREFKGASTQVKMLLLVMFVLFLAGLGMVSVAPLHASK